jgi:WD40 repeat protein
MKRLAGHTKPVFAVAWSNSIALNKEEDGKPQVVKEGVIASGDKDGQVIFWDGASLKELHRLKIEGRSGSSTIRALAFSPDGRTLAAAVELDEGKGPHRVVLIDTLTGRRIDFLQVNSLLASVAWSPDGNTLITACGLLPWDHQVPIQNDKDLGEVVIWERVRN